MLQLRFFNQRQSNMQLRQFLKQMACDSDLCLFSSYLRTPQQKCCWIQWRYALNFGYYKPQNKINMTHLQREQRKMKERYDQIIRSQADSFHQKNSNLSFASNNYPNKSQTLSGIKNLARRSQNVGKLIGKQRKSIDTKNAQEKDQYRSTQNKKNAHLNKLQLQDKQLQTKGYNANKSVGPIIDREIYLQKLNNKILQLKSKMQAYQAQQNDQLTVQAQTNKKKISSIDRDMQRSRTIEQRKSNSGRIYTRLKTPSAGRSLKFAQTKHETSSFYKWKPKVDQNIFFNKELQQNTNSAQPQHFPSPSQNRKKNQSQLQRPMPRYRVKQKTISKATINQTQDQNETLIHAQNAKEGKRQNQKSKNALNQQNLQKLEMLQKQIQIQAYGGVVFQRQSLPEWQITKIQDDFRQKIKQKLQIPKGFPIIAPEVGYTFQEYEKLGVKIFQLFNVKLEYQEKKLITRKFKNGLYYQLDKGKNAIWYYSGTFYFGDWQVDLPAQSQKNGFGFQYVPNKYIYLGYFKEGMRHGKGTIQIFDSCSKATEEFMGYDGQWANGRPGGFGRQIDQNNNKYIGEFVMGQKTGKAIILNKDGLYYEGEVRKNLKHGLGFQKLTNGDTYTGQFQGGKFQGLGTYNWKNGSMYVGQFVNGKRKGKGKWSGPNGDSFQGEYIEDIKNGWGKFTWANGQIYQGEFRNDLRHGEGTYKHPNGKNGKFMWVDGQIDHRIYSKEEEKYRCRSLKQPQAPTFE